MKKTIKNLAAKLLIAGLIIVQVFPAFAAEEYEVLIEETVYEEVSEEVTEEAPTYDETIETVPDEGSYGIKEDITPEPVFFESESSQDDLGSSVYEPVTGPEFMIDDICFATISNYEAKVVWALPEDWDGKTVLNIPATIATASRTYKVIEIGESAFTELKTIEEINIPDTVKYIDESAFTHIAHLKSLIIPDSVTAIGELAFAGCEEMTSVIIGKNVRTIGRFAFKHCIKIKEITIPDSVVEMEGMVFQECYRLNKVTLGKNIHIIPTSTFEGCHDLKEVVTRGKINAIEGGAFASCLALARYDIPEGVTVVAQSLFQGATGLATISIPSSVKTIEDFVLFGCEAFDDIICYAKTPPAATNHAFDNIGTPDWPITVYVPYGCKTAYEQAPVWRDIREVTFVEMEKPYNPSHGGSSASSVKPVNTGTWGTPVSNGTWTINPATGLWSYKTNAVFKNTWGYIINPDAGYIPQWFYFDAAGNSLVGWQWIMGADGKLRCYYLNPLHNGSYGACFLNTVTPDGYVVNANGEWTVNGITQTR